MESSIEPPRACLYQQARSGWARCPSCRLPVMLTPMGDSVSRRMLLGTAAVAAPIAAMLQRPTGSFVSEDLDLGMTAIASDPQSAFATLQRQQMADGGSVMTTRTVDAVSSTFHAQIIQDVVDVAVARGIGRVVIPQLDPDDASVPWLLDGTVTLPSGLSVDASSALICTTTLAPGFLITEGTTDVTLNVMHMSYQPARPTFATVNAAGALGTFVGVQNFGSHVTIRGHFTKFRAGVRNARPSGSTLLAENNDVQITHDDIDFGIIYFGQRSGRFVAHGRFSAAVGSPDAPHAIYGTSFTAARSTGCHVDAYSWDSTGGEVVKIRDQGDVTSSYIIGHNVPAMLWVLNPVSPMSFTTIIGRELTGVSWDGTAHLEPIRSQASEGNPLGVSKTVTKLYLEMASTVAITRMRAISATDGGWTFSDIELVYNTSETDNTRALAHFTAGPTRIGSARITNLGTGNGVIGLRFLAGAGHTIDVAPTASGVVHAIYIHDNVSDASIRIDRSRITSSSRPLEYRPRPGVTIDDGRPLRDGRWYSSRPTALTTTITIERHRQHWYPIEFDAPVVITALAVKVVTPIADAAISVGIAADSGDGLPRAILEKAPSLALSTAGTVSAALASPLALTPGRYWITYIVESGSSNPSLLGVSRGFVGAGASAADSALEGAVMRASADSTLLADGQGEVSASASQPGVALVAYQIAT